MQATFNCQAVLFDLDGTLIDSEVCLRRLWQQWGQRHGIALETILKVRTGTRAAETIRLVAPHLQIEQEVAAFETDEIADMAGVRPYLDASEMLGELNLDQWAIVTSASRKVAEARLKHVNLAVPHILVTSDDVSSGKPAPDGYLLASRRLHKNPGECVVIEDSPAGVQAAKAAGMRVVALSTTCSPELLREADAIVSRLGDLGLQVTSHQIYLHMQLL